jgi:hypothetical protein
VSGWWLVDRFNPIVGFVAGENIGPETFQLAGAALVASAAQIDSIAV